MLRLYYSVKYARIRDYGSYNHGLGFTKNQIEELVAQQSAKIRGLIMALITMRRF